MRCVPGRLHLFTREGSRSRHEEAATVTRVCCRLGPYEEPKPIMRTPDYEANSVDSQCKLRLVFEKNTNSFRW